MKLVWWGLNFGRRPRAGRKRARSDARGRRPRATPAGRQRACRYWAWGSCGASARLPASLPGRSAARACLRAARSPNRARPPTPSRRSIGEATQRLRELRQGGERSGHAYTDKANNAAYKALLKEGVSKDTADRAASARAGLSPRYTPP